MDLLLFDLLPGLKDVPEGRTQHSFLRAGLRQSMGVGRAEDDRQIEDLPAVAAPATGVLGKDPDGDPPNCAFNYASVIGMLWHLCGHSRCDLGFAVSQAARFSFAPKCGHELALIRIGQHLKGTMDEGSIVKPCDEPLDRIDVHGAQRPKILSSLFYVDIQPSP